MSEKRRFANHSEDEIMTKRQASVPKNTQKNNKVAAEIFKQYLREKKQPDNFEEFDEVTLAEALGHFYMDARTKSGELYKGKTFENIRYSLNRYLKSPPYLKKFDILSSDTFIVANENYKTAMVEIKKCGKGVVEHYPKISETDLKKLYQSIFLSPETPTGLLNRVQMNIRLFFCRRANENMEKMTKDTFVLAKYEDGKRYIVKKNDELTKNRREYDNELISGHMPEDTENTKFCPVETFLLYLSKLNPNTDRLWQYPRDSFSQTDDVWYQNRPIGRDTLSNFMQSLSKQVQLSRIYTNHCVRVTGTSILSQKNFSAAQIMSVTGHKSVSSLAVYQKVTDREKHAMGSFIKEAIQPSNLCALPAPLTMPALPAPSGPIACPVLATNSSNLFPPAVHDTLLGFNIEDLFCEFNEPLTHVPSSTSMQQVQTSHTPIFHGCTISNVNINININKS